MGNDNKSIRGKIPVWQFFVKTYGLLYITLVAPCWLSAQTVQESIENQLKNSYVKSEVCSLIPFYGLKPNVITH